MKVLTNYRHPHGLVVLVMISEISRRGEGLERALERRRKTTIGHSAWYDF